MLSKKFRAAYIRIKSYIDYRSFYYHVFPCIVLFWLEFYLSLLHTIFVRLEVHISLINNSSTTFQKILSFLLIIRPCRVKK